MDEDTFYMNAALGTDLLTSYVGASDDDDEKSAKPRRPGCLAVLLTAGVALVIANAWL